MVKADLKLHVILYDCANCGEIQNPEIDKPITILKLSGVKPATIPNGKTVGYDMVYTPVFLDPNCFRELELPNEPPAKIVTNENKTNK